jgi:hypothetical protein
MKTSPIKTSFNGGELSPLIAGRVDQAKYGNGCSILEGLLPTTQGPLVRRGGTMYVNEARLSSERSWLKDFIFNVTQSYTLEFGNQYIRFYTNRGLVLESSTAITGATKANPCSVTDVAHGYTTGDQIYIASVVGMTQLNGKMYKVVVTGANTYTLTDIDGNAINSTGYSTYTSGGTASRVYTVTTPYAVADLTDSLGNFKLKFVQSNNVMYMLHTSYQTQKLTRAGNTNWTVSAVAFANGPFQVKNSTIANTVYSSQFSTTVTGAAAATGLIRLTVGTTAGLATGNTVTVTKVTGTTEANGRWVITVVDGTHIDLQNSVFTNAYTAGGAVKGDVGTSVTLTASTATFASTDVGELFYIEKSAINVLPQWSPGITVTIGDTYRAGVNTYIALNGGTTGTVTPTHTTGVTADGNPGISWLYSDSGFGVVQISAFSSSTSVTATIVTQLPSLVIGSTNATYLWAHSIFSNTLGWPEVGTFFRDRLTLFKGIQMATSVTSDYENFAPKIGGIQTADSGIVITLPTANPTRWAIDAGDLLVGTAGEEIVVTEITNTAAFGPTNIRARRSTKYGSRNVDALLVGYGILFATRSGQKVRDLKFVFQINGYDSVDVTVWGEHIAKGADGLQGISQMCYQQEPYSIVWACTTDGKLIAFTYNREQDVQGWHRHPIGGSGFVESVCCIPSPDGTRDDVWIRVKRTINGVTRRYVEYIVPEFQDVDANISNAFYVDAGLTYSGSSTSTISGLYHLKGSTVDVLAQGGAHPQVVVDSTGSIALQFAVTKAQIGLPCPARMRTMRLEGGSPLGTSQGKVKRITHIILRLLKSLGGRFGPDDSLATDGSYAHMDEISYRHADDLMDTPPPTLTGDTARLQFPDNGDFTDGYVEVLIDTPTPFTLVALMADEVTNEY